MTSSSKRVRVVAALIGSGGRFLVQQRMPNKSRANLWEFPGGKVEPGERDVWARGIRDWAAFERAEGVVASTEIDADLRRAIARARAAPLEELAKMLPEREHWRLYPRFLEQAAFLDLEADGKEQITVGG